MSDEMVTIARFTAPGKPTWPGGCWSRRTSPRSCWATPRPTFFHTTAPVWRASNCAWPSETQSASQVLAAHDRACEALTRDPQGPVKLEHWTWTCPECDQEVAGDVLACPDCGAPAEVPAEMEATGLKERPGYYRGGAPAGMQPGQPLGETSPSEADGDADLSGGPVVTDKDLQSLAIVVEPGDELANHAFRAAILGLFIFMPLCHLYSFWLLIKIFWRQMDVSPKGQWKMNVALLIDTVILVLLFAVWRAVLTRD